MTISSSIFRKIHSNEPPTSEELDIIRRELAGSLAKIEILSKQISRVSDTLHDLSLREEKIRTFVEGHARLITPFRKLLPEILQEICYHCLPTTHNAVMSIREAPLLLGRVCSQWRRVSHTTPKLWASIHIAPAIIPARNIGGAVARKEAISSWLSRSGVLPLSISLSTDLSWEARRPNYTINAQIQPFFDIVTQYTQRWKSFHLTLYDYDWSDFFTRFAPSDFPLLEVLYIDSDFRRRRDPSSNSYHAFHRTIGILQAPRLRSLSWPSHLLYLVDARVSWRNLSGLDLGNRPLPLGDIANHLAKCPSLETCSILLRTIDTPTSGTPSPPYVARLVMLPLLRTLSVVNRSGIDPDETAALFDTLSTPSLRHLHYEQAIFVEWTHGIPNPSLGTKFLTAFSSFLYRLTHPLEELTIVTNPFSGKCATEILRLVPELKRLSMRGYLTGIWQGRDAPLPSGLQGHLMDDSLLRKFIPNRSNDGPAGSAPHLLSHTEGDNIAEDEEESSPRSCLCPNLEVFDCGNAIFSDHCTLEFLRSRTMRRHKHSGITHLRRASITLNFNLWESPSHPEEHDLGDELRMLERETGLLVTLLHQTLVDFPSSPPPPVPIPSEPLWSVSEDGTPSTFSYFGF